MLSPRDHSSLLASGHLSPEICGMDLHPLVLYWLPNLLGGGNLIYRILVLARRGTVVVGQNMAEQATSVNLDVEVVEVGGNLLVAVRGMLVDRSGSGFVGRIEIGQGMGRLVVGRIASSWMRKRAAGQSGLGVGRMRPTATRMTMTNHANTDQVPLS